MPFKPKKLTPQQLDRHLARIPPIVTYHPDTGIGFYPDWIHKPIMIDWEHIEFISHPEAFNNGNDPEIIRSTYLELVDINNRLKPYRWLDEYIYSLSIEIRLERLRIVSKYPELFQKGDETDEHQWTSEGGLG